jgi:hypothetical protein
VRAPAAGAIAVRVRIASARRCGRSDALTMGAHRDRCSTHRTPPCPSWRAAVRRR